jgi:hypothetical protein
MLPLRSLACALPAVLALEPARAGDGQDLAALVPEPPALWIELPDIDRATEKLADTSLGKLWSALSADIDPSEIAMHFELPEAVLERGATGGVRGLLMGAALDLGLSEERAERWAESLGGALTLARWERPQGSPPLAGLAFAASLRAGASSVLAGEVLDALEDESGPWGGRVELLELARGEDETRAVWGWEAGGELPAGYLVVRPGLIACTFERGIAERLAAEELSEAKPDAARQRFQAARESSRERGELVWLRLAGSELERAGSDPQAHAWLTALGLEGLASLELGLTTGEGQIRSRLRIEPRERHVREDSSERKAPSWSTLDVLPSDTLAVMGVARSPRAIAQGLGGIAGALGDSAAASSILAKLDATPLFGRLGERGALADETLLFARSSGPGIPQFYAAIPSTPALEKAFGSLPGDGEREFSLGHGLLLRQRRLVEGEAWVFFRGAPDAPRSFLALTRLENTWVGSDVSAQLQSLLRQRSRERLAVREESLRAVRNAIAAEVEQAGRSQQDLIAFLHVRSSALVELLWPYAQIGLEWSGAVEDLESLPDPQEIARMVGDTTIVVLDLGDAIELHGRGLLGGLVFLL